VTALDTFRRMVAGEIDGPPVGRLLDMRMTEIDEGRAMFVLDAGPQHASPLGTVHGGIICDVADAALGCAHASLLGEGETFATVELKINFLKPVWTGRLTAVGEVIKAGRTLTLLDCRITDASGSLVAYATSTCMTLRQGEE